MRFLFQFSASD